MPLDVKVKSEIHVNAVIDESAMKIAAIPYQLDSDIVYKDVGEHSSRPRLPAHSEVEPGFEKPDDIPLNKRNFAYTPCGPNPLFTELRYCTSEYPFEKVGINYMDRSDGLALQTGGSDVVGVPAAYGWRSGRCNACIKEGTVYWEVEVLRGGAPDGADGIDKDELNTTPHVRVGVSRREASLEAPVGCDEYGYGVRDHTLESIHEGRVSQTLPAQRVRSGDRLGLLLQLPSAEAQRAQAAEYTEFKMDALLQDGVGGGDDDTGAGAGEGPLRKRTRRLNREFQRALLREQDAADVVRDHIAIRYRNQLFFEATDYVKTTRPEYHTADRRERHDFYTLAGSYLRVYVNGEAAGDAFTELRPFLPPFSELKYNDKFYFNYWRHGAGGGGGGGAPVAASSSAVPDDTARLVSSPTAPSGATHTASPATGAPGVLLRNKYVNNGRLGYYPTLSCFNGGAARLIASPGDMRYWGRVRAEHAGARPLCEVFDEQVADDVVWDVVDEVDAEDER